jgi:hypothetical protein
MRKAKANLICAEVDQHDVVTVIFFGDLAVVPSEVAFGHQRDGAADFGFAADDDALHIGQIATAPPLLRLKGDLPIGALQLAVGGEPRRAVLTVARSFALDVVETVDVPVSVISDSVGSAGIAFIPFWVLISSL